MKCPFCKSERLMPVRNSLDMHWMLCLDCHASGPQLPNADDAKAAFNIPAPPAPTLRERIFGGKKDGN